MADRAKVSTENLKQIIAGTSLPSGAPRGVGPHLQSKLDAAYPGWSALGQAAANDVIAALPNAVALRSALGQIASSMQAESTTTRELVALLLRDVAIRPNDLEATLVMLLKLIS